MIRISLVGGFGAAALLLCAWVSGAHAQAGAKSAQQLEEELARRDSVISDLQRRVQALEEKLGTPGRTPGPGPSPAAPTRRGLAPPSARTDKAADQGIDEELLARALERSLVLSGGILLPRGQFEIEPGLQYDYTRRSGLGIVGSAVATRDIRRDNYVASLGFRAGLPWDAQLELKVPYGYQKIESITAGVSAIDDDTGIGDVRVGVSKQLLQGGSGGLGLIGNITWQESTGDANLAVLSSSASGLLTPSTSLGVGFDSLQTTLTAVKRMDPLVFLGSLSHSFNRSTTAGGASIDPSDTNSGSFRAILAASPDVSLRGGLSLARTGNTKLNGATIPGSRQFVGLVELGGSVVLTRRVLLDVAVGAGLTQDSPDLVLGVSLPIRF